MNLYLLWFTVKQVSRNMSKYVEICNMCFETPMIRSKNSHTTTFPVFFNYHKFPFWSEPRELEDCLHHGGHCTPYRCDVLWSFRFGRTSALGRALYRGKEDGLEPSRRSLPRRTAKDWGMWRIKLCDTEDLMCVCLSVHRCICVEKKNQLDATEWFIALVICSACFGHRSARNMLSIL